jgi:helicase MOV-10
MFTWVNKRFLFISGLGTDVQEVTANIVLLGDHKQLGAIVNSSISEQMGLGVSLMERIMNTENYKAFETKYVTQLLDNYRSHPAILQFSNVLFYDSKLRAKVAEPEKSFGVQWKYLNNKKIPILFHCVKESSELEKNSSFNTGEIKIVKFYVDLLLNAGVNGVKVSAEDIGIVSPYKAQLNKLKETFLHAKDVEIGTAEYYQGREKKIIVISTVKSGITSVGFLKNEKRLNVCITRAKSLLIIVGNGDTLQV